MTGRMITLLLIVLVLYTAIIIGSIIMRSVSALHGGLG